MYFLSINLSTYFLLLINFFIPMSRVPFHEHVLESRFSSTIRFSVLRIYKVKKAREIKWRANTIELCYHYIAK